MLAKANLNEDQGGLVLHDEVDLAVPATKIAFNQAEPI